LAVLAMCLEVPDRPPRRDLSQRSWLKPQELNEEP
jgi:hypothetical protein